MRGQSPGGNAVTVDTVSIRGYVAPQWKYEGMRIMSEHVALTAARGVALLLGGELDPDSVEDRWRAWVALPGGLRLMFYMGYGGKGEVSAHVRRPGYPGMSAKCGEIGVNLTRDPVSLAKDVERRLLPGARKRADAWCVDWATLDQEREALESLAREFNTYAGVSLTVEDAGHSTQRIALHYHEAGGGSLRAILRPGDGVHIEQIHLYGENRTDKIRALLAVLAG
jgi:hypothetical protein